MRAEAVADGQQLEITALPYNRTVGTHGRRSTRDGEPGESGEPGMQEKPHAKRRAEGRPNGSRRETKVRVKKSRYSLYGTRTVNRHR